jgi:hypothetical protein
MRNVIGDMYKNDSQYLFNNPDAFVDSLNDLETNGLTNLHFDSPQGGDGYNFTIKNGKIIPDKNTKVSFKDIISNKSYKSYKFYDPQKEVERKVEFNLDDFKGEVGTNLDLKQETLSSILLGGTVDNL